MKQSAACALAPSIGLLIVARTVQGAGAAAVAPLTLSLLSAAFPPERRPWALGIFSAVTRRTERGGMLGPDERLTREQALRMYTINNAYMTFEDDIKGSIEVNKLADLAVLTDVPLTCPEDGIKDIRAEITVLGGNIVHP